MTRFVLRNSFICLTVIAASASPAIAIQVDPLSGSGDVERETLLLESLISGSSTEPSELWPYDAFALPADAAPPSHRLEGALTLSGDRDAQFTAHRDTFTRSDIADWRRLPRLEVDLVQNGSFLVPVEQGLVFTGHARWNVIFGPGRIWSETGDRGWSRAALPFALVERNQNCTHNGVVSFLFDGVTTSTAVYQIAQETCLYFQFDLWGHTATVFETKSVAEAESLRQAHAAEVAGRMSTRPLAALGSDNPGLLIKPGAFGDGLDSQHLTALGVVYNGIHYVAPAKTRAGDYPFPESLRLPSYSTAKTAFAAVALLWAAQEYGVEATQELLRDHLPKIAAKRYAGVTFEHTLDMTTGHYRNPAEQADEKDPTTQENFFLVESEKHKLHGALGYPTRDPPGKRWVYHTSDTYLLVSALGSYLRSRGHGNDLFELIYQQVYRPLAISQGARGSLRTGNSTDGRPYGGYGLFWTTDDIAKLATFLSSDRGKIDGQQKLHPKLLASAMQRDPLHRGLDATHRGRPVKYRLGVWARSIDVHGRAAGGSQDPERSRQIWLTQMLGYGGIAVNMLPNGAVYYYFGDNDDHSWLRAVRELAKLPPMTS